MKSPAFSFLDRTRSVIPEGLDNPSRWLIPRQRVIPPALDFPSRRPRQGSHRRGTPAGVRSLGLDFRWCRPLRDQPPARIVASLRLVFYALVIAAYVPICFGVVRADARAGTVEWSDGHKLAGAISLTPGKDLHIFSGGSQVTMALDQVKEIQFKPEKEQMWEGFYFPNAGQATQVKTGEVYPIRYLQTQITLGTGQVVAGHLFTTVFYLENDDGVQKVVVMAKQSGPNGSKLSDLIYPTAIRFDGGAASTASAQIYLTQAGFVPLLPPVILTRPDLTQQPVQPTDGKPIWTVVTDDPGRIIFSVEAVDGIHVAWPDAALDSDRQQAVETGLKVMQDFYDTRTALGSFADADAGDIYSLVIMKRFAKAVDPNGTPIPSDIVPWSLVMLRWKYDPDQKKAILLNRVMLSIGRQQGNSGLPTVFKQPELLKDITGKK